MPLLKLKKPKRHQLRKRRCSQSMVTNLKVLNLHVTETGRCVESVLISEQLVIYLSLKV